MQTLSYDIVHPLDWFQLRCLLWDALRAVPTASAHKWSEMAALINRECTHSAPIKAEDCAQVTKRLAEAIPEAQDLAEIPSLGTQVWNHLLYSIVQERFWRPRFMNLGYVPTGEELKDITLSADDEANRLFIQLYERTVNHIDLHNLDVVEVGCGGGGGAHYLATHYQPRSYLGIDLVKQNVDTCRQAPPVPGLSFRQAAAESLGLEAQSIDALINIESSFTYDFPQFLHEVSHALRPGGYFMISDHRPLSSEWGRGRTMVDFQHMLRDCDLDVIKDDDITSNVVAANAAMAEAKESLVTEDLLGQQDMAHFREIFHCAGSKNYERLRAKEWQYRSILLKKPE